MRQKLSNTGGVKYFSNEKAAPKDDSFIATFAS